MTRAKAKQLRQLIEQLAVTLADETALTGVELFPAWVVGKAYAVSERAQYNGTLYKCVQAHTSQSDWTPDKTPALWAVVSKGQTGTIDDPIDAARGMEYTYGLYYKDPDDGKTYICERTGEPSGGTVILQFLPHELIGLYFEEVT
ncbi:MAG: hypothetical protein PUK39_04755 [Clostridiales bacterium]|nr:hypothetical protein [Clostridiales bacterium]